MTLCTLAAIMAVGCASAAPPTSPTATRAITAGPQRPAFDPTTGELEPPSDYRSWVYLTSGFQMGYGPAAVAAAAGGVSSYDTVFVDPAAYGAFVTTGAWPDRTMFVLEIRTSEHTGSIVTSGHYQTDLIAVESEIKDARIPGGWGYFSFNTDEHGPRGAAKRLPETRACYGCHTANGAVEHTFTQFYPTLFSIARAHGTVRSDFVGIPPSVEDIHTQILAGGYATARAAIDATAAKWPEASIAKEVSLNRLGYQLVQEHRVDAALEVFADITHRFPDSASAWDSYSETLEGAGKLAAAAEATAKGLAAIAQMPAGPRRDAVDQALHERAARLPR